MTDSTTSNNSTDAESTATPPVEPESTEPTQTDDATSQFGSDQLRTIVQWTGILFAGLFVLIGGIGIYRSLGSIIDIWVASQYQPFARLLTNLAVVSIAGAGLVVLLRRRS